MENLVIIPTYNEKENIENIIDKVFSLPTRFDILIVDDGSPDGTAEIVKELQKKYPGYLHIEERTDKQGLGTAYIHGFKWALKNNYQFIFEMDADFSHNPEDLPRLLEACKPNGVGMSVGSRYCKGGQVKNWPLGRWMMSYFASFYVRMVLWINIKDTTAGFKCYKREVLEKLDLDNIWFIGYAFQIEMKYSTLKSGFKVVEVPITFIDRVLGVSKMDMKIFKEAFIGVIKLRKKKFK
ncbi:MAG: polyprenol monophosphomannose synthase [Flavobacteriales bacterium]|nr:polyprenol monophosphomannose synthase [Flavobacteriales bacterium]